MSEDVFFLSASDRFNYGDLLFPLIAQHELKKYKDYNFYNVAIVASNLEKRGGLKTLPYRSLFIDGRVKEGAVLMVGGGEVLGADWSRLLSFINPIVFFLYQRLPKVFFEKLIRLIYGVESTPYPFIPSDKKLLSKVKLIYHAVGGMGFSARWPEVKASFESAQHMSVRERATQNKIKESFERVEVKLVPDTVILLSDIFTPEDLQTETAAKYICFQFGFYKTQKYLPEILKQLKRVYAESGLTIGLLAIGNCPGHSDGRSIEWVRRKADFPTKILPHENIKAIAGSIVNAEMFAGTSLHGVITAMSYHKPFAALGKTIIKLDAYTKTWAPKEMQGCVDYKELADTILKRLNCGDKNYLELVAEQKKLCRQSFLEIHRIIETSDVRIRGDSQQNLGHV